MSCLAPCPACKRHVSTDETVCPFCSAALPDSIRCQPRQPLRGRLSRAGLLAAGAALMGVEACSGASAYGTNPIQDAGADTATMDGTGVPIYGAAPPLAQAPPDDGATGQQPAPTKK